MTCRSLQPKFSNDDIRPSTFRRCRFLRYRFGGGERNSIWLNSPRVLMVVRLPSGSFPTETFLHHQNPAIRWVLLFLEFPGWFWSAAIGARRLGAIPPSSSRGIVTISLKRMVSAWLLFPAFFHYVLFASGTFLWAFRSHQNQTKSKSAE